MNIFKKIWKKIFSSNYDCEIKVAEHSMLLQNTRVLDCDNHSTRRISFNLYSANGGMVIETNRYDNVKDRQIPGLYVIHSNAELGEEISKIITMERLR